MPSIAVYVVDPSEGHVETSLRAKEKAGVLVEEVQSEQHEQDRRTIYLLEKFPAEAVALCQNKFKTILPDDPDIVNWREKADAILVREKTISAGDIAACKRLRAIGKQGTGIDIIDQLACHAAGIKILNTPGVNASTVAELTLCLALAVARQIRTISVRQVQDGEIRKEHCCGQTLEDSSIGILGMGAIGRKVAIMFHAAFNCKIFAYDPFMPPDTWAEIPHTRVETIDELLPQVNLLSLHVPLTKHTHGLISMAEFRRMKPNAILLNLARGGLVNENDLTVALEEGLIWGAGLDCHEEEPPTLKKYERLWSTGRVISTPHIGATCASTQVKTATAAVQNIFNFFQDQDLQ